MDKGVQDVSGRSAILVGVSVASTGVRHCSSDGTGMEEKQRTDPLFSRVLGNVCVCQQLGSEALDWTVNVLE